MPGRKSSQGQARQGRHKSYRQQERGPAREGGTGCTQAATGDAPDTRRKATTFFLYDVTKFARRLMFQ
jgi:hypothetical protein